MVMWKILEEKEIDYTYTAAEDVLYPPLVHDENDNGVRVLSLYDTTSSMYKVWSSTTDIAEWTKQDVFGALGGYDYAGSFRPYANIPIAFSEINDTIYAYQLKYNNVGPSGYDSSLFTVKTTTDGVNWASFANIGYQTGNTNGYSAFLSQHNGLFVGSTTACISYIYYYFGTNIDTGAGGENLYIESYTLNGTFVKFLAETTTGIYPNHYNYCWKDPDLTSTNIICEFLRSYSTTGYFTYNKALLGASITLDTTTATTGYLLDDSCYGFFKNNGVFYVNLKAASDSQYHFYSTTNWTAFTKEYETPLYFPKHRAIEQADRFFIVYDQTNRQALLWDKTTNNFFLMGNIADIQANNPVITVSESGILTGDGYFYSLVTESIPDCAACSIKQPWSTNIITRDRFNAVTTNSIVILYDDADLVNPIFMGFIDKYTEIPPYEMELSSILLDAYGRDLDASYTTSTVSNILTVEYPNASPYLYTSSSANIQSTTNTYALQLNDGSSYFDFAYWASLAESSVTTPRVWNVAPDGDVSFGTWVSSGITVTPGMYIIVQNIVTENSIYKTVELKGATINGTTVTGSYSDTTGLAHGLTAKKTFSFMTNSTQLNTLAQTMQSFLAQPPLMVELIVKEHDYIPFHQTIDLAIDTVTAWSRVTSGTYYIKSTNYDALRRWNYLTVLSNPYPIRDSQMEAYQEDFAEEPQNNDIEQKLESIRSDIQDNGNIHQPYCKFRREADHTFTSGVVYEVVPDNKDEATGFTWTSGSANIYVDADGIYVLSAYARFTTNSTGYRLVEFRVNNDSVQTYFQNRVVPYASDIGQISCGGPLRLHAGDYVRVRVNAGFTGSCALQQCIITITRTGI